jgi:hypothetical protein
MSRKSIHRDLIITPFAKISTDGWTTNYKIKSSRTKGCGAGAASSAADSSTVEPIEKGVTVTLESARHIIYMIEMLIAFQYIILNTVDPDVVREKWDYIRLEMANYVGTSRSDWKRIIGFAHANANKIKTLKGHDNLNFFAYAFIITDDVDVLRLNREITGEYATHWLYAAVNYSSVPSGSIKMIKYLFTRYAAEMGEHHIELLKMSIKNGFTEAFFAIREERPNMIASLPLTFYEELYYLSNFMHFAITYWQRIGPYPTVPRIVEKLIWDISSRPRAFDLRKFELAYRTGVEVDRDLCAQSLEELIDPWFTPQNLTRNMFDVYVFITWRFGLRRTIKFPEFCTCSCTKMCEPVCECECACVSRFSNPHTLLAPLEKAVHIAVQPIESGSSSMETN